MKCVIRGLSDEGRSVRTVFSLVMDGARSRRSGIYVEEGACTHRMIYRIRENIVNSLMNTYIVSMSVCVCVHGRRLARESGIDGSRLEKATTKRVKITVNP